MNRRQVRTRWRHHGAWHAITSRAGHWASEGRRRARGDLLCSNGLHVGDAGLPSKGLALLSELLGTNGLVVLEGLDFLLVFSMCVGRSILELVHLRSEILIGFLLVVLYEEGVGLLLQSDFLLLSCLLKHQKLMVVLLHQFKLLVLDVLVNLQAKLPLLLISHPQEVVLLLLELLVQHVSALLQLIVQALHVLAPLGLDLARVGKA